MSNAAQSSSKTERKTTTGLGKIKNSFGAVVGAKNRQEEAEE